jgi:hypothetical protein
MKEISEKNKQYAWDCDNQYSKDTKSENKWLIPWECAWLFLNMFIKEVCRIVWNIMVK